MTEFTHSVESIGLADWLQLLTFMFALILFWVDVRRRRIEDAKSLKTQRVEIYQRLEIESNSVFKFEAENKDILPEFKTHLGPPASSFLARAAGESSLSSKPPAPSAASAGRSSKAACATTAHTISSSIAASRPFPRCSASA